MDKAQRKREWYQANKEQQLARVKENNRRYRAAVTEYLNDYLSSHPCVDCGEADLVVLDFDHVTGEKVDHVSALRRNHSSPSLEKIIAEVAKCEVRCANCHRRVTHKRRLASIDGRAVSS